MSVIDPATRESFLSTHVQALCDGAYYITYYPSGKAQINLTPEGKGAFLKLLTLVVLEREGDA